MNEVAPANGSGDFVDPNLIVAYLGLGPGMRVADFGSGAGHFVIAMAKLVGESGQVLAIDVQESALEAVKTKVAAAGLKNVQTVRADLEVVGGTKLPDQSLNLVLIANTIYQARQRSEMIQEAARLLVTGGSLVIVDWEKGKAGLGPPDELRLDPAQATALAQPAGFTMTSQFPAGNWHFGVIFKKQ